ncbi:MAG: polyprenyl synthetase family protein [Deltaproteobacteria bacterium]|nr:MAG: polyprenyl synthetase family protein [Deltaproteobacteria bacterium]
MAAVQSLFDARMSGMPRRRLGLAEAKERWGSLIEHRLRHAAQTDGFLGGMLDYQLGTGGKRLRALLPSLVAHNLGGDGHAALDLGVGLELLHNASLVHDDCQDGDLQRRGVPTLHARWGTAQAINAGDALIFRAFAALAATPVADRVLPRVSEAMVRLTQGQCSDLRLQETHRVHRAQPLATYLAMAEAKTAALFALALELGAIAAGAPSKVVADAGDYGRELGLCFQVRDDLLDVVGGKGRLVGGDVVAGKLTFLVAWSYEHAPAAEVQRLRTLLATPADETCEAMVAEAIDLLHAVGAVEAAVAWLSASQARIASHPMRDLVPGLAEAFAAAVPTAIGAPA